MRLFDLKDKVAIVTGAGAGLGKATALGLARAGADVAVCARTVEKIQAVAEEIRSSGSKALAVSTDVRESEQIAGMITKVVEEFGGIDILGNNAGGHFEKQALELSERGGVSDYQGELDERVFIAIHEGCKAGVKV